jgi:hypothetical protein
LRGSVGVARCDQSAFVGNRHEAGAVVAIELAKDVADVAFGGEGADHELAGDVVVVEAACDQEEDVAFSIGKARQRRQGRSRVAAGGELGDQAAGDVWGD